mgnify:CR=1 FL=1
MPAPIPRRHAFGPASEGLALSGFLYALLAALLASLGARDQALVGQLGAAQGRRPALLIAALVTAVLSSALAAWLGGRMLGGMAPAARGLFGAIALLLAGGEMLFLAPKPAPQEPTHSLFAAGVVLLALQLTDAARFLILALAVGTAAPITAGLGGALGSMAALVAAWAAPHLLASREARVARRVIGAVLLLVGLAIGVPNVIGINV